MMREAPANINMKPAAEGAVAKVKRSLPAATWPGGGFWPVRTAPCPRRRFRIMMERKLLVGTSGSNQAGKGAYQLIPTGPNRRKGWGQPGR